MENTNNIEQLLTDIEKGKIRLTPEQKDKLYKGFRRPFYNDNWEKLKVEFYEDFDMYNYIDIHNKEIVCSLSLQEAIGTLLKIKYKVDNVRRLPNYEQLKEDVKQILSVIQRPVNKN